MNSRYKPRLIIAILVAILVVFFANRSCSKIKHSPKVISTTTVLTKIDTVFIPRDSIIYKTVTVNHTIKPVGILPEKYQLDSSYAVLSRRFKSLVAEHAAIHIVKDNFPLDSIGNVTILDTIQFNKFRGKRAYHYQYNLPVVTKSTTITNTNTILEPPKRQLYIGAGGLVDRSLQEGVVVGSILYKDKKDRIYTVSAGSNETGNLHLGFSRYWKLKF